MIRYLSLCSLLLFIPISDLSAENVSRTGTLQGVVVDASTDEPVSYVYLHLEQINRSVSTDRDGRFRITNIPTGTYTLLLHRIGFVERSVQLTVGEDEEKEVEIRLLRQALRGEEIEVLAEGDQFTGSRLQRASVKISGIELRRNLGTTVSETLSSKPGFSQRTMGAATSRPVIRGLGDERVIILQDGERTGDVSSTSADHSVTIDPLSANEIEVARGPAALAYGSNAIGGVVNVIKNNIATSVPSSLSGSASVKGSSVNTGLSAAGQLSIPRNDFVLNLDINGRYGDDYRSPAGTINNSNFLTTNSSAGLSYIRPWGYSGLAFSTYVSNYGIPPDPLGGHPSGVDIEMQRFQIENRNEFLIRDHFLKLIEASVSYRYYNHKEFETTDIIGTEYITNTVNVNLNARHQDIGFFENGRIGLWGEVRDYIVIDRANIETTSFSGSLFAIQEVDLSPFTLELGARLDAHVVRPREERFSSLIGQIEQREFFALASSAQLTYDFGRGWTTGAVVLHSFRPPSSEELFSQGPHIASYSFEIGNPELDPERGIGYELFTGYQGRWHSFRVAGFYNDFSNYNFPRDTGRESVPFPNLNEWQFEGIKADIYGAEAEAKIRLHHWLTVDFSASYTIGNRNVTQQERDELGLDLRRDPLPMIPPFNTTASLNFSRNNVNFSTRVKHSFEQSRVAEFEEPTDAYTIIDLNAQYRYTSSNNMLHTFSLSVQNLLNTEYRNHLSRLKELFPEPGINLQLFYRMYF